MRALRSRRATSHVAAVVALIALAACAPRQHEPRSKPQPERAPTEDDINDVSVGYGTQSKRSLTTAVGSVTERDIAQSRVTRIEELLQGRVAGVHVTRRPNGELSVRIRGATTLMAGGTGGEPLWVVDNMPIATDGLSSALAGLNPQDIERIDVLKDAGSTAIYGSRGMNGVILIRTRHH